jgi:cell division septation protein DedD
MDISRFVAELLYDFECVVIPGLGGFIANDHSSTVNRINHQFKPPFRTIMFNRHVKANDGLLVNQIAISENISFEEARSKVDQFVEETTQQLENGKTIAFDKIGSLRFDDQKNFIFEQDFSVNYNPESYGLSGFVSPPVKRVTDEEKLRSLIIPKKQEKTKPADRKPDVVPVEKKEKKKRNYRPVLWILSSVIIILVLAWGFFNLETVGFYWDKTSLAVNQLYSQLPINGKENVVNEARYVPRSFIESEDEIMDKINQTEALVETVEEINPAEIGTEPAPKSENEKPATEAAPPVNVPSPEPTGPLYYIIAGSFTNVDYANRLVDDLKLKGFDAKIADTNADGMYRVAYTGIKEFSLAKKKLFAIREEDNPDAWLFRK